MKFDEYQEKLGQLYKLIEFSNTGPPADIAKHLNVSERTARRLVEKLKEKNAAIVFCRKSRSYIFKN